MGRQKNDGRGRLGGRAKGTPNKTTQNLQVWVTRLLQDHTEQLEQDWETLLPEERMKTMKDLLNYVIPKKQSLTVEEQVTQERKVLEELIRTSPEETIEKIAKKVLELQRMNEKEGDKE